MRNINSTQIIYNNEIHFEIPFESFNLILICGQVVVFLIFYLEVNETCDFSA